MINYLNLYKDPLTGLNNLFALLECDLERTFGVEGTILYLDLINLNGINNNYGRDIGDIYIRSLADIIKLEISKLYVNHEGILTYRSGGDDFIIRFPSNIDKINELTERMNTELNLKMKLQGVEGAGIHFTIWSYTNNITSVYTLLKQCNVSLFKNRNNGQLNNELPRWVDYMIMNMLARVKDTIHLLQESNSMALNDDISGLANHRAASIYLNDTINEHYLNQTNFSVLFIDGDNLKKFNELGYKYGNEMIKNLGKLITSSIRHNDKVFRWLSGDEFLVLLKETNKETALLMAERIRTYVEATTKNWEFPVTISIGVANCPTDGSDIDSILSKAETANSQAKKFGKNRVI